MTSRASSPAVTAWQTASWLGRKLGKPKTVSSRLLSDEPCAIGLSAGFGSKRAGAHPLLRKTPGGCFVIGRATVRGDGACGGAGDGGSFAYPAYDRSHIFADSLEEGIEVCVPM